MKSNKWNITKEFLLENYVAKKISLTRISKETKIPYETLFWYKKKFHIPSNPLGSWNKGKRLSPRTEFKKGVIPWNAGKKGLVVAWNKGKKLDEEYKKKIAIATKTAMANPKINSKIKKTQFKKGVPPWNKDLKGVYSTETIEIIRKARLKQKFPKHNTQIEVNLFNILDELGIRFKKHIAIKNICQADAFIEPNIILFADGDYWHCNPRFYHVPKTEAQIKNTNRDKKVNSKLIEEGYIVGRIWESDLINNKEECKNFIKTIARGDKYG